MVKETITYIDYNGNERTEDFYFNLTKAEVVEMELMTPGGLSNLLIRISNANDVPEGIKFAKEIVLRAYGEKSPDGRRFIKSPEISEAFSQTEAYSQLFIKLTTNPNALVGFVNGVIPNDNAGNAAVNTEPDKIIGDHIAAHTDS